MGGQAYCGGRRRCKVVPEPAWTPRVAARYGPPQEDTAMGAYTREELEQAFRTYWRTGAVGEDWEAWADLFTDDCEYVEHMYGSMRGRAVVRAWIVPIMEKYRELYTSYEWHTVDPEGGRVVFYMQNRRDHPS